jgi:S-adenosylmethionine:tRNA ribosyltransferase-isomerase
VRLEELDFELPDEAIAQTPAEPRDSCRLMHLAASGHIEHAVFSDLPRLLRAGDTLVFNDSKVLPARVLAQKPSGGMVEVLFLRALADRTDLPGESWEALVRPSRRLRVGSEFVVAGAERLTVTEELGEGRWVVSGAGGRSMVAMMEAYGQLPLPPYIANYPDDASAYQTVYAEVLGSAAAPTAGLHFTRPLLQRLEAEGIESARVTLHVGLDTFLPIRESVVEEHRIHTEWYDVPAATLEKIAATRARGGRVVAVGTTATRVLETLGQAGSLSAPLCDEALRGSTSIYITPGYEFLAVDTLLTNFHLPRSTVLTLTMAFAGVERIMESYREAIASGYRFFSFGDAMLVDGVGGEPAGGGKHFE